MFKCAIIDQLSSDRYTETDLKITLTVTQKRRLFLLFMQSTSIAADIFV